MKTEGCEPTKSNTISRLINYTNYGRPKNTLLINGDFELFLLKVSEPLRMEKYIDKISFII